MPHIPNGMQDLISVSGSVDTLLPGAADCIFQQHSTYLDMKMNNTVSTVALILCTVILNEVLSLHSAFNILQILLAVRSYSVEPFGRSWGLWRAHASIRLRNTSPREFYLKA